MQHPHRGDLAAERTRYKKALREILSVSNRRLHETPDVTAIAEAAATALKGDAQW